MQTKRELIYNDVCTVAVLGFAIYRWSDTSVLGRFWIGLFVYFLIKQVIAHTKNYLQDHKMY